MQGSWDSLPSIDLNQSLRTNKSSIYTDCHFDQFLTLVISLSLWYRLQLLYQDLFNQLQNFITIISKQASYIAVFLGLLACDAFSLKLFLTQLSHKAIAICQTGSSALSNTH